MNRSVAKARKRVAIMKDVLKQLAERRIHPRRGNGYVVIPFESARKVGVDDKLDAVVASVKRCDVCALGAALVAGVNLYDGVTAGAVGLGQDEYGWFANRTGSLQTKLALRRWFTDAQMTDIELAFEDGEAGWTRYRTSTARLRAIAENIIRNKGTFVLEAP